MHDRRTAGRIAAVSLLVLGACGGGGGSGGGGTPPPTVKASVGPAGATVPFPGGPTLVIPPGALAGTVELTIAESPAARPPGALGPVFEFGPSGQLFAVPAVVTFPVPAGTTAASVYWTEPGSATYDALATTVVGAVATAQVSHFSSGFVGASCTANEPCIPANECHVGARTCNGTPACVDQGTAMEDGASCGTDSTCIGGICGGASLELVALCDALRTAAADLMVACFSTNPAAAPREVFLSCEMLATEVASSRLAFDGASAQACVEAMAAMSCAEFEPGIFPPSCRAALTGTVTNGGACASNLECANGFCASETFTCPGTCTAFVGAGGDCSGGRLCAAGLACAGADQGPFTCVTPAGLNQPCSGAGGCQPGLYCQAGFGTCAQQKFSGGDCADPDACALGFACQTVTVGQTTTSTCVPVVGQNASCGIGLAVCGGAWNCIGDRCTAPPSAGAACDPALTCVVEATAWGCLPCADGLCPSGTCVPFRPNGAACTFSEECYYGACTGTLDTPGVCVVPACDL
jgi:hypothetical protein